MDPADPKPEALNDQTGAGLSALLSELDRPAPTDELAERVGLHVNGVRRQLERMHEAGLLERQQVVRGRGRPRDEWSVAVGAAPSNPPPSGYADLARWLARSISL